jgi:hypothetical protein
MANGMFREVHVRHFMTSPDLISALVASGWTATIMALTIVAGRRDSPIGVVTCPRG